jgi:excisionase family DNA binding protein
MPVYFIQAVDGGPIKIGYAANPENRLAEIQRMSPTPLQILTVIEGGRIHESQVHRHFAHLRKYGEWFEPTGDLLTFIQNPYKVEPKKKVKPKEKKVKQPPIVLSRGVIAWWGQVSTTMGTQEAADVLDVHVNTIKNLIQQKQLKAFKVGRVLKIHKADLMRFVGLKPDEG